MLNSLSPKNLQSDTVKVGWLVTATGVIAAMTDIAHVWGLLDDHIAASIKQTLPLLCIALGPLAVHFRVNQKTNL